MGPRSLQLAVHALRVSVALSLHLDLRFKVWQSPHRWQQRVLVHRRTGDALFKSAGSDEPCDLNSVTEICDSISVARDKQAIEL